VIKKEGYLKRRSNDMSEGSFSILGSYHTKKTVERIASVIFTLCAFFAVLAVFSITVYMLISGVPALFEVGLKDILFGTVWMPNATEPKFGILYVILTSIVGTTMAIIIGVPIGLMTAVFLAETAPKPLAKLVRPAVELLAGIPSVIYGLLGILILNPVIYKIELAIYKDSPNHQFTGGSNLISAVLVLAIISCHCN
jgi:phosphate transport system permease protein